MSEHPSMSIWEAHIVVPQIRPCWMCGKPTRFVQVDFETPLHPGSCTVRAWREYDDVILQALDETLGLSWWERVREKYRRGRQGEAKRRW